MALDRATTARADPAWAAERLADPESRAMFASREGVLVDAGEKPALVRRPISDLGAAGVGIANPILLSLDRDRALFAVDLGALLRASSPAFTRGTEILALRSAGALLPRAEGGLAAYLTALLNWHRTHRFCPNCGTPTEVSEAGYSRRCPSCGATHFPRFDPVVIARPARGLAEHDFAAPAGRRASRGRPPWGIAPGVH